jgi:hypothetical protein
VANPTKRELNNSTAAVAAVAPPPPEQPSHHKPKGRAAKVPAAGPAPAAAPSTFTVPERQGDRRDSDSGDDDPAADVLLRALQVRKRYGDCSDMWLHRRLHDDSGFPKPVYVGPVRYWRLSDLLAWERAQAERPTPKPRILKHHDAALAALADKRAEQKRNRERRDQEYLDSGVRGGA